MSQKNDRLSSPVLESAWQRYAEFYTSAATAINRYKKYREVAIVLAMIAVVFAVFSSDISRQVPDAFKSLLSIPLILILIINFILLAMSLRSQQQETGGALRSAAEEIKKEIYLYRTILQWHEERDQWLSERLTIIQRHVADTIGSELSLKSFRNTLPPDYDPENQLSDPGFTRLMPDDYLRYRLENQLLYYTTELAEPQRTRSFLQIGLLVTGGLSLLLAALGGSFNAWVAVVVYAAAALISWLEPRQLDASINTYNQLIAALNIIRDRWRSLSSDEQTSQEFFKLVVATEKVIWSHYNKNSSEVWRAIDELNGEQNDALDEVMMLPAIENFASSEKSLLAQGDVGIATVEMEKEIEIVTADTIISENGKAEAETSSGTALVVAEEAVVALPRRDAPANAKKGRPHAFVVMPFGRKQGVDGRWLDFDAIYNDLIRPSLETAGFEAFRADEESVSGDILTDMFQELLLADLVIADLSIDNANVFYELGVRHAMRKRGLVHIQSGRSYMPFDIFNVRTIPYHTDKNGRPDIEFLEKDRQAITKITRETWASDADRVHSPIFNLLDGLPEPDRKTLRTPLATGFWREYNEWQERVAIAQRQKRIGDVLLLTEEISNPLIKEEAIGEAGKALQGMGRHELALKQYRLGLQLNKRNLTFRREEAFHLNRLGRTDEAIVKLERLLQDQPKDTEAIAYLGRIYKQMWMDTWLHIEDETDRINEAYNSSHWLIKTVKTYLTGYSLDQNNYYPGINALTGSVLMDYLAEKFNVSNDPDVDEIRANLPMLKGAVHFALESTTRRDGADYWALVSLAELEVSIADDPAYVSRAYRKALTSARKNMQYLQSSIHQLNLLKSLNFRPEFVATGLDVLQAEINRIHTGGVQDDSGKAPEPPQVFLFSGYFLDRPGQKEPRFPPDLEKEAREKLVEVLNKFNPNGNDLAITSGAAAGGDILFMEVCLERGMKIEIHLPFEESRYLQEFVSYGGGQWVERYYVIRNNPNVSIRQMSDHIGRAKAGDNIYERNEKWALYSSLMYGIDRSRLILLWDGIVDEIPGGPDYMLEEFRQLGGISEHINTRKFGYWQAGGKVSRALDTLVAEL
jgi:tetratricopeptide (TPR) repeat protein